MEHMEQPPISSERRINKVSLAAVSASLSSGELSGPRQNYSGDLRKSYVAGVIEALQAIGMQGLLNNLRLGHILSAPEIPQDERQKGVQLLYDLNKKAMELSVEQLGESEEARASRVSTKISATAKVHGAIDLVNTIGFGDINSEAKDRIEKEKK